MAKNRFHHDGTEVGIANELVELGGVHLTLANMFVGAKHDRSQYEIVTNNLYAVMLRPLQK